MFLPSTGQAFLANVAYILGAPVEGIEQIFAPYEEALFAWLFMPAWKDDTHKETIYPQVYRVWDAYTSERIKKLNAPPA